MTGLNEIFDMVENINNQSVEAQNGIEVAKETTSQELIIQGEKINVERGRLESLVIYDVTESELTLLEKTTDASVWLNFFIGTLSTALSFLISLLTINWEKSEMLKIIFICVVIIMGLASLICCVFWIRGRGERNKTINTIRNRGNK